MTSTETTKIVNIKQGDMSAIGGVEKVNASIKQTQNEANKAAQVTTKLNDALTELNRQNKIESIAKSAARYASETGNARTAQLQLNAALQKAGATHIEIQKAVRAYSAEIKKAARETDEAADAAKRYDQAFTKASFKSAAYGDLDTGVGTIRSLADTIAPGAGGGLTIVQDLFAAREGVERLGPGLKFLGESATQSKGVLGSLSSGLTAAIPGLTGTAAGLGALALAAAPFAAAAAVAAGAFAIVSAGLENARKQAEAFAKGVETSVQAEVDARQLANQGRYADLEGLKNESIQASIANQQYIDGLIAQRDEQQKIYDTTDRLSPAFAAAKRNIDALNVSIDEALPVAADAATRAQAIAGISDQYAIQAALSRDLTAAWQAQEKAEQDLAQTSARAEQAIAALEEQERALIASMEARRARQDEDLARQTQRNEQDAAFAIVREERERKVKQERDAILLNEQLENEAVQHAKAIAAIQQRGFDAILQAREDLAKKEAETAKQAANLIAQYHADELKAEAAFNKARDRELEDYRKARKRAIEDQFADELNSLINNDISSLIVDQRAFELEQKRGKEDFRTGRGRDRADFDEEQAARAAALQQKLADLAAELAEYTAATAVKIAQIEQQTATDIANAQAAFEQKQALDAAARERQNTWEAEDRQRRLDDATFDSDLKLARDAQDREIVRAREDADLQVQLTAIQTKAAAEQAAVDTLLIKVQELQAAAAAISFNLAQSGGVLPPKDSGGGQYTGAGGSQINNPKTNAPIGPSNVTPFSPQFTGGQNTRGRGGDGGGNMSVQITPQVVEIGGMQFVPYSVFEDSINAVVAGIHRARNQRA